MFWSLLYDHPQGLSFVLSAFTTFSLACFVICLFGMWPYAVYVYVCPVYLSVGCLVVKRPDNPQTGTPNTYKYMAYSHIPKKDK
jgi:hypothetical protein